MKPRNLARDPRISLVVVDPEDAYRWFKLAGTATLVDEGADAQIDRLSKKYTGRDVYASRQPGEQRVSVRITPDRIEPRRLSCSETLRGRIERLGPPLRGAPSARAAASSPP